VRVAITPDTKDWTWVLREPCPECGFDTQSFARADVGAMIRANAAAWVELLAARPDVRQRPRNDTWSPLEYGCHVRDVFRLFAVRLDLMLTLDDPVYENWDQDVTAIEERYDEQDPAIVAPDLAAAATRLADAFDAVHDGQWERTGNRTDGARFTVESFARYLIHDPVHHLHDASSVHSPG
jgi:DinB superfamily